MYKYINFNITNVYLNSKVMILRNRTVIIVVVLIRITTIIIINLKITLVFNFL